MRSLSSNHCVWPLGHLTLDATPLGPLTDVFLPESNPFHVICLRLDRKSAVPPSGVVRSNHKKFTRSDFVHGCEWSYAETLPRIELSLSISKYFEAFSPEISNADAKSREFKVSQD